MKDTMTHNIYNTPVPHNTDSDESDDEEMSPMGSFWAAPEDEEWNMVEISHESLRGTTDIDSDGFISPVHLGADYLPYPLYWPPRPFLLEQLPVPPETTLRLVSRHKDSSAPSLVESKPRLQGN